MCAYSWPSQPFPFLATKTWKIRTRSSYLYLASSPISLCQIFDEVVFLNKFVHNHVRPSRFSNQQADAESSDGVLHVVLLRVVTSWYLSIELSALRVMRLYAVCISSWYGISFWDKESTICTNNSLFDNFSVHAGLFLVLVWTVSFHVLSIRLSSPDGSGSIQIIRGAAARIVHPTRVLCRASLP